jgi:hypothetical protein
MRGQLALMAGEGEALIAELRLDLDVAVADLARFLACDFFTVESAFLRRYYALFFIAHDSRHIWLAGCTAKPTGVWVTQQARNLGLDFSAQGTRFLIRDRDSKYSRPFDAVFRRERVLCVYVDHHNRERPHRARSRPPQSYERRERARKGEIRRHQLGGLIHEYYRAAA